MSDIVKVIIQILGALFAIMVVGFTGYQTYSLLFEVSGSQIVAVLGLVLFEISMIYWWAYFLREADGLPQLGLSLLAALFGLLLVGGATGLHLGAIQVDVFGRDTPAKLITVAAIFNLIMKFLMPIASPAVMLSIKKKVLAGKIMDKTMAQLATKADDMSEALSDELSADMLDELQREVRAMKKRMTKKSSADDSPLHAPIAYPNGRPVKAEKVAPAAPIADGRRKEQPAYQVWLHNGRRAIHMIEETYDWAEAQGTAKEAAEAAPPGHYIIIKLGDGVVAQYAAPEAVEESENGRPTRRP